MVGALLTSGNHPLSIEAIFPTLDGMQLCELAAMGNHPLSIEAIFPTPVLQR